MFAQKRDRLAALAGAILLTLALPIAIDQGYFRYNPYPLPIIGLIAALLYIIFFTTSNIFIKWARAFYARYHMLSLVMFIVIFSGIGAILGTAEWFAIRKSQEHISSLPKQPPSPGIAKESAPIPTAEEIAKEVTKRLPQPQAGEKIIYAPTNSHMPHIERVKKENEARRKIRIALTDFMARGNAILAHCEGVNIIDGSPVSPEVNPWKEFEKWNIDARDYFYSENKLGPAYQERKEHVAGMVIPPSQRAIERGNLHTYQQLKARLIKMEEFIKEFPDVY